jgi:hypothetical protein
MVVLMVVVYVTHQLDVMHSLHARMCRMPGSLHKTGGGVSTVQQ